MTKPTIYATVDRHLPSDYSFAVFDDESRQRITVKSGRQLTDDEIRAVVGRLLTHTDAKERG